MGPSGIKVNPMVNMWSLVGGGLNGANIEGGGPLGCSENHHQVVVVVVSAVNRGAACPASCFGGLCSLGKNS